MGGGVGKEWHKDTGTDRLEEKSSGNLGSKEFLTLQRLNVLILIQIQEDGGH